MLDVNGVSDDAAEDAAGCGADQTALDPVLSWGGAEQCAGGGADGGVTLRVAHRLAWRARIGAAVRVVATVTTTRTRRSTGCSTRWRRRTVYRRVACGIVLRRLGPCCALLNLVGCHELFRLIRLHLCGKREVALQGIVGTCVAAAAAGCH